MRPNQTMYAIWDTRKQRYVHLFMLDYDFRLKPMVWEYELPTPFPEFYFLIQLGTWNPVTETVNLLDSPKWVSDLSSYFRSRSLYNQYPRRERPSNKFEDSKIGRELNTPRTVEKWKHLAEIHAQQRRDFYNVPDMSTHINELMKQESRA